MREGRRGIGAILRLTESEGYGKEEVDGWPFEL